MIAGDIDAAREEPEYYARLFQGGDGQVAETVVETVPGRWRSYYENIAEALVDRSKLAVTAESTRAALAVIEAAREAAATGKAVDLT